MTQTSIDPNFMLDMDSPTTPQKTSFSGTSILIEACPGSGKSTTARNCILAVQKPDSQKYMRATDEQTAIYELAKKLIRKTDSICMFSLNSSTREENRSKVAKSVDVHSFHSFGLKQTVEAKGRQILSSGRSMKLIRDLEPNFNDLHPEDKRMWYKIKRASHFLRLEGLPPTVEAIDFIKLKYDELKDWQVHYLDNLKKLMTLLRIPNRQLEFVDMVWMGNFYTKKPVYDWGIVDECQDISPTTLSLMKKACRNLLWVGDENQAINAFAGADPQSLQKVRDMSQEHLSLRTTFRLPPNIVRLGNLLMPDSISQTIKTKPGKDEENITLKQLASLPHSATMVLCRTNAPLARLSLKLLSMRVSTKITNSRLKDQLINYLDSLHLKSIDQLQYPSSFEYRLSGLTGIAKETERDTILTLKELATPEIKTIPQLKTLITTICRPNPDGITLSTIHRAKGLEADNIVILNPPVPMNVGNNPHCGPQELNLEYVAETRTKQNRYTMHL